MIRLGLALFAVAGPVARCAADDQAGRPVIRIFDSGEIHAKGPVLAFAELADECLFVGSNHLVVFDGYRWQPLDIPGAYAFRALAAAPGPRPLVWIGATGALGYAAQGPEGSWAFTSLLPALRRDGFSPPDEIDVAAAMGGGAAFVSERRLLVWTGSEFQAWSLSGPAPARAVQDETGALWILRAGRGLYRLDAAGPPRLVRAAATLPPGAAEWLVAPPAGGAAPADPSGMLIGTTAGAFRLTSSGSERLPALSAFLSGEEPDAAVAADNDRIAVGTRRGGVVFATRSGDIVAEIDHANGLGDDSVFGLWSDRRGGVWAGLEDACARFDRVGFASRFDAREGLDEGLPRKVLALGNTIYVLTDKALYRLVPGLGSAHLSAVLRTPGRFSDAAAAPDALWVAGTGALWRVTAAGAFPALPTRQAISRVAVAPWLGGGALFTRGYALDGIEPSGSGWSVRDYGIALGAAPVSLAVAPGGDVWLSTVDDGIHRFEPDRETGSAVVRLNETALYGEDNGLPHGTVEPRLGFLGGNPFAFTEDGVLGLGADGFAPLAAFGGWDIEASAWAPPAAGRAAGYWLGQRAGLSDSPPYDLLKVRLAPAGPAWEPLRVPGIDDLGEATSLDVTRTGAGTVAWIGGKGGLLRLRLEGVGHLAATRDLEIREVEVGASGEADLHPARPLAVLPGAGRVAFGFSAAQPMETDPAGVFYETRLIGAESAWSPPDHKTVREFIGLAPGRYRFEARRVDRYGRIGRTASYAFIVLAPWYLRWPSLLGYGLLAVAAAFAVFRWRMRSLQAQANRLDRLVAQRTRELELSGTAKTEFLESISHEIRNPLNGILGLTRLLRPARLPPEEGEIVRSLQTSAERLHRVAEDVLGHASLEFGAGTVANEPFALAPLLRSVRDAQAGPAALAGCVLRLKVPEDDEGIFFGDPGKIRTIVGNFVGNAIKYAPGGPVDITADWTYEDDGPAQVYLDVRDRGPGIPIEEQELIFQKYVRGSGAKASGAPGSGVGLALCRTLARRMGGSVGIESPIFPAEAGLPARGASFHLWLPLRPAPRLADPAPGSPPPTPAPTPGPRTALIVDDEEFNRIVLAGIARELGFRPIAAADAGAAVATLQAERPEVVFLDLELPGMKGADVARLFRQLPGSRSAIQIATTGHDSARARESCRAAGMNGFLLKPFTVEQVEGALAAAGARPGPAPRFRALELYARETGESEQTAQLRLVEAVDREVDVIRTAGADPASGREALRSAGHRLRSLAALAGDAEANRLAARLESSALTANAGDLAGLIAEVAAAAGRLKADLRMDAGG